MKIRGDINAVSEGPDRGHALLAAFLEATGKIDRRALQRRGALIDAPSAVNLESLPTLLEPGPTLLAAEPMLLEAEPMLLEESPTLLEASPTLPDQSPTLLETRPTSTAPKSLVAPYTFRRANLVRP